MNSAPEQHTVRAGLSWREAATRAGTISPLAYQIDLDLTTGADTFESRTTITFDSRGGHSFVELDAHTVHDIRLNHAEVPPDNIKPGRVMLDTAPGMNVLVVHASMRYRHDGEGLHRSVDPVDANTYIYAMCFLDAASSVFACFDQPDLKAPYTFTIAAPTEWVITGNAAAVRLQPGQWRLGPTLPLATYFVTLTAGPFHVVHSDHDGIPLTLQCRRSLAPHLDREAPEIFTLTAQCFDEFHRLFGSRYPFGDYNQVFVPDFNAGAMENPGCVLLRDQHLFATRATRNARCARAVTIAHEMAHQWFGNTITPVWWDDLWLNESFAEYLGTRVAAEVTDYHEAWDYVAWARRTWGLTADQRPTTHPVAGDREPTAAQALQNFDGISYVKGANIVRQIAVLLGDDIFFRGPAALIAERPHGNASMDDLINAWQDAAAPPLGDFVEQWLNRAGPDTFTLDRQAGTLRRAAPADHPARRHHHFSVTTLSDGLAHTVPVEMRDDATVLADLATDGAVILDRDHVSWGVYVPDHRTVRALRNELPRTGDKAVHAAAWNNVKSGYTVAAVDPDDVVELAVRAWPADDTEDLPRHTLHWLCEHVLPLASPRSTHRVHDAVISVFETAPPGSDRQLAALRAAGRTATDGTTLRRWLTRVPGGLELDDDLRWRMLNRLAVLGHSTPAELEAALGDAHTTANRIEYVRAFTSRPDPDAKAFAWSMFTGSIQASNFELEAAGHGLWRPGQDEVTAAYVSKYHDQLPLISRTRRGFVGAQTAEAFFPKTQINETCLHAMRALTARSLDGATLRRVLDQIDTLERLLAVRRAYPKPAHPTIGGV